MLWEKEVSTYHYSGLRDKQEKELKAQAEATLGVGGGDCLGLWGKKAARKIVIFL